MQDDALRAAAEALLFRTVETVDPATGATLRRRVPTPLYREVRERRAEYEAAKAAYAAAHAEAQKSAAGRGSWPMLGPALQLPVKQAHDRWRAAGAEKIERAEALLGPGLDVNPQGSG